MNQAFRFLVIKSPRQSRRRRTLPCQRHVCARLRHRDRFMAAGASGRADITKICGVILWEGCGNGKTKK